MGKKDKDYGQGYSPSDEDVAMMFKSPAYVQRKTHVVNGKVIQGPDVMVDGKEHTVLPKRRQKPQPKERPDWVKAAMAKLK